MNELAYIESIFHYYSKLYEFFVLVYLFTLKLTGILYKELSLNLTSDRVR